MLPRPSRHPHSVPTPGWAGGFSVIELMTVLVVASVLVTLAAPSFRDLMLDNRRTAAINALIASLQDARMESVKRGARVVLCKSSDGASCSTDDAVTWRSGWLVFVDTDADGTLDDAEKPVIRIEGAISGDTAAAFKGNDNVKNKLIYRPGGDVAQVGTITYCDTRGASKARAVIIASNGRPRSSDKAADGSALSCP